MGRARGWAVALLFLVGVLTALNGGCRRRPLWLDEKDAAIGDTPAARDAWDARPPVACPALEPLAERGPLTPRRTRTVFFAPDGQAIALRVAGETSTGGSAPFNDLLIVTLPEGTVTAEFRSVRNAVWLGSTGQMLVTSAFGEDLFIVPADGAPARPVATGSCEQLATSDGARVFFLRGCGGGGRWGQLDALHVASGAVSHLASAVLSGSLAVSPNGRWLAYLEAPPAPEGASSMGGVLHVVDVGGDGRDTTVASVPGVSAPAFIENGQILFQAPAVTSGETDVYRYFVDRAGAARIASAIHVGFGGYEVSSGLVFLLGARWSSVRSTPNRLVSFVIDGGKELTLANDLVAYQFTALGPRAFAFSRDGAQAIYVSDRYSAISSASTNGGVPSMLSLGSAVAISPYADRLAIFEESAAHDRRALHVRAPAPGPNTFEYVSASPFSALTFVPGDRGLVFVEHPPDAPAELRHLSFSSGTTSVLGRWTRSDLPPGGALVGVVTASYPVDPTGCFAVIDSDLPGVTGTSLSLLPAR